METSLNITGKDLCQKTGIPYHGDILKNLRELGIVTFFKIGRKYFYPSEGAKKVSDKLRSGEISIKADNGYYITINRNAPREKGRKSKIDQN